jgi:hypothetical protein
MQLCTGPKLKNNIYKAKYYALTNALLQRLAKRDL